MENHGKPWKTIENHGKPWKNLSNSWLTQGLGWFGIVEAVYR
jgi:hypothetical protein